MIDKTEVGVTIISSVVISFLFGCWFMVGEYKQGQIDCANGKMQYEIRKQADGSSAWERKEK